MCVCACVCVCVRVCARPKVAEDEKVLGADGKEFACNAGVAGDVSWIPGSGRSPGGGNGNPLQYSCLENPMDRGAWQAIVQKVAESDTT